jgi:hypothetical protein
VVLRQGQSGRTQFSGKVDASTVPPTRNPVLAGGPLWSVVHQVMRASLRALLPAVCFLRHVGVRPADDGMRRVGLLPPERGEFRLLRYAFQCGPICLSQYRTLSAKE